MATGTEVFANLEKLIETIRERNDTPTYATLNMGGLKFVIHKNAYKVSDSGQGMSEDELKDFINEDPDYIQDQIDKVYKNIHWCDNR